MNLICIHTCAALCLLALWGHIETGTPYLILCAAASFLGALCFSFNRLFRLLREKS